MASIRLISSPSPITTETVALAGVSYSNLRAHGDTVYFVCRDPKNKGRCSVKSIDVDGNVRLHTPLEANVRSAVHEYGGGAFCIGPNGEGVIYTDFPSNSLYWVKSPSSEPLLIYESKVHRFADFSVTNSSPPLLLAIMEDHTESNPSKVKNSVVTLSLDGEGTITTLASGHDFYSCPQIDPRSKRLAYIAWDHPNMPWDHTSLYIQALNDNLAPIGDATLVHGGNVSVAEPRWTPDGSILFLSDLHGWYNLYERKDGANDPNPLCPREADFCSGGQGWILGLSPYAIMPDGSIVSSFNENGASKLVIITRGDVPKVQEFERSSIPPSAASNFCPTQSNGVYFIVGSTTEPAGIWFWKQGSTARLVLPSMDVNLTAIQAAMTEPRLVEFPSDNGSCAYGYYYPPPPNKNLDSDFKPPLLVKAHGGPTSQTSTVFRLDIQFWTSRGFAVLDVDYGGSTGHGKQFRQSLQGNWGVTDVADVCNGAKWCVEQGLANGDWLCIDGSSAGGYTTMAALTFTNVFAAGASLYGISDLVSLYTETHKFESKYMDGLVGPYPEKASVYKERCPINYTDKLNCPMILLQGDEDKVVPPNQAETMFDVLKSKGLQTSLVVYKGEQHGFRKGENIRHALNSEYNFFCQVFGFEPQAEEGFDGVKIGERVEV